MKILKLMILTGSFFLSGLSVAGPGIDSISVFGDSLSDQGKLYQISFGKFPKEPYYHGRFSNGPVWVEYMAQSMGFNPNDLNNYALGGATTNLEVSLDLPPYSLTMEVDAFLVQHVFESKGGRLYVIWIGGNDYWTDRRLDNANKVVDTIIENIASLIDKGGEYFLIPNLPDMAATPFARQQGIESEMKQVLERHNTYLHEKIETLRQEHPEVTLVEFDAAELMNKLMGGSLPSDITNFTEACYNGNYSGEGDVVVPGFFTFASIHADPLLAQLSPPLRKLVQHSVPLKIAVAVSGQYDQMKYTSSFLSEIGEDVVYHCPGHFFWDGVHPTTAAHKIVGSETARILQDLGFHRE